MNVKKENITINDFIKLDIRVGFVIEAKPVPESKKLIQLSVDLGKDYGIVSILAGMLPFFPDPTVLVNKKYLFLANLEPRAMAGLQSQGMFLAVETPAHPVLLPVADDTPVGTWVR